LEAGYPWHGSIDVKISAATDLAIGDIVSSDPYCVVSVKSSNGVTLGFYKTKVINSSLNPEWNEKFSVSIHHLDHEVIVHFAVWDNDVCTPDDFLGQCQAVFSPNSPQLGQQQNLELKPRENIHESIKVQGSLNFTVSYFPGQFNQKIVYKYHSHAITGIMRSLNAKESVHGYATYQVQLNFIGEIFGDFWQPWNRDYPSAKKNI